jgi:hypothetical protein
MNYQDHTADLTQWTDHPFLSAGTDWAFEDPDFGTMTKPSQENVLSPLRARIPTTQADTNRQFFRLNIPWPK